jgi:phage shock protein C
MKNPKMIVAFLAGVVLTLLFLAVPSLHLWQIPPPMIGNDLLGLMCVLFSILFVAAIISRSTPERPEPGYVPKDPVEKFFLFLKNFKASHTDRWIGGICGGLGETTPVPSWIWRLGFVISIGGYGLGLVTYWLLWVLVPRNEGFREPPSQEPSHSFLEFLRSLKRSNTDHWFGGVCGGLAERTLAPAWVWRLGFVALAFGYGSGLMVYVLLWIFVPRTQIKNFSTT